MACNLMCFYFVQIEVEGDVICIKMDSKERVGYTR